MVDNPILNFLEFKLHLLQELRSWSGRSTAEKVWPGLLARCVTRDWTHTHC